MPAHRDAVPAPEAPMPSMSDLLAANAAARVVSTPPPDPDGEPDLREPDAEHRGPDRPLARSA